MTRASLTSRVSSAGGPTDERGDDDRYPRPRGRTSDGRGWSEGRMIEDAGRSWWIVRPRRGKELVLTDGLSFAEADIRTDRGGRRLYKFFYVGRKIPHVVDGAISAWTCTVVAINLLGVKCRAWCAGRRRKSFVLFSSKSCEQRQWQSGSQMKFVVEKICTLKTTSGQS